MAGNPRQDLYLEISNNLEERELTNLRDYVSGDKILPAGFVEKANAHQIFNQFEKEGKSKHGDLTLLANILRKVGRDDYAEKVENVAENERKGPTMNTQQHRSSTDKEPSEDHSDKMVESEDDAVKTETDMDTTETSDQGGTVLYEITRQPAGGPPLLPVVVEILEQVLPSVETPEDMLNYTSALETLSTIDEDKSLPQTMLERIKSRTRSITDLLTVVKAVKKLERFKGIQVSCVKTGSLVFYLQCTDMDGLGELWFMYKREELNNLMYGCLISEETLQQLCTESISVKATINTEDFRKTLLYLLTSTAGKGQLLPRLPQEYPRYLPHIHATRNVLDVLHLDRGKIRGEQLLQEKSLPTQIQEADEEDSLLFKLGTLQIADATDNTDTIRSELPHMPPDLASLDIRELDRLMGSRRKRSSSMSSDSSGYITGTPGSGPSRPDSPTGEGNTQNRLETLLAELNTSEVRKDKAQQCYLYLQIGDLYRTKLYNLQSALQYYQYMLKCAQELPEDIRLVVAYSRLGLTCDILGLQEEASNNHEMALRAINRLMSSKPMREIICVAYKNLASSLALSGHVSDAKANYERAMDVAMETGNKTEQMAIFCMLGDLHREQLHEPQVSHQYYMKMLALARNLGRKDMERIAYNKLGQVHYEMGEYEAALEWNKKHLKMSAKDGEKEAQTTAHINVGDTYRSLGKLDQATSHFNTALQMAQQTGDQQGQMDVYRMMGEMHREQLHSPQTAIQYYEQHLTLARQMKDKREEGLTYNRLGLTHHNMGEYEAALKWNLKYLKIVQQIGDKTEQTTALTCLGNTYRFLGKLDQATSHFNTALQMAQQTGDLHGQMKVYFEMGEMHREQLHSPRTAIQYYEQSLTLARQLKDKRQEGLAYKRLGLAHYGMGEYEAVLKWNLKHMKIVQQVGDKKEQIAEHHNVGETYRLLGKLDQATSYFNTALQMAQQTGDLHGQMNVYLGIGKMHMKQLHSPRTAIQYYEKALDLARQLNDRNKEEVAYHRLGLAYFNIGEHEAGLERFQMALKVQGNGDRGKQGAHLLLGAYPKRMRIEQMEVCFQMGERHREQLHSPQTAIQYYEHALALARQLGDRHEEGRAYDRLGRVHFELKEYEKALDLYQMYLTLKEDDSDKQAQITAHKNIAKSYKKLGKKDLARTHYQSAMKIAMETGDKQQQDIRKKIAKL